MTEARKAAIVAEITTRDEAGRHFTERYDWTELEELEADDLIEISRPVHEATGISYSQEYYNVGVTEEGEALVDNYADRWYDEAARRVEGELFPDNREAQEFCLADWPEGDEHWRWLIVADADEIAAWVAAGVA